MAGGGCCGVEENKDERREKFRKWGERESKADILWGALS